MSPTATRSEAAASASRRAWAPRWLVVLHRYLGVVLGLLMLAWCLSGVVMLFVAYPSLPQEERLARLGPIDWAHCCAFGDAVAPDAKVDAAAIEQFAGRPILRLKLADGGRKTLDLSAGRPIGPVSRLEALAVAEPWALPAAVDVVIRDQWTVSGELNRARPFWRIRLADPKDTDLYVSQVSGQVVQRTTATSRFWNWLGAVPHWLYPTILRQDAKLWSQVVIWTSLAGTFLTVVGLYLGLMSWRPFGDKRLSPFRGLMTWHHLTGLATGVLTLTWVVSGLVSMNPWGFLESPGDPAADRIAGPPPAFADVRAALEAAAAHVPTVAQVKLAPFNGQAFVLAGDTRLDAAGRPAPLSPADLAAAGRRLGAVAAQGPITTEDAYYFSHHEPVTLPAWRVLLADGRRAYLDPRSGALLAEMDARAKGYRWLHQGLHRFDFVPGWRQGPVWAAGVLILLIPVAFGVGTGVWLAWRRIGLDLHQLRQRFRST